MKMLQSLQLKNFRSIGSVNILFNNTGLTSITGYNYDDALSPSNGVGKSTIKSGLCYNLYGKTETGRSANAVLSWWNPKDCSSESLWLFGNNKVRICRYRNHKTHNNDVHIYFNGTDISGKDASDTQKIIDDFLGFNYDMFCILLTTGSLSKSLVPFLLMPDKDKKEFIGNILNIGFIGEARDEVVSHSRTIESGIRDKDKSLIENKARLESCKETINDLNRRAEDFAVATKQSIRDNQEKSSELAKQSIESEKELALLQNSYKRISAMYRPVSNDILDGLLDEHISISAELNKLRNNLSDYKSPEKIQKYTESDLSEFMDGETDGLRLELYDIIAEKNKKSIRLESLEHSSISSMPIPQTYTDKLEALKKEKNELEHDFKRMKKEQAGIPSGVGICSQCKQEITGEYLAEQSEKIKEEINRIVEKGKAVSKEIEDIALVIEECQTAAKSASVKSAKLELTNLQNKEDEITTAYNKMLDSIRQRLIDESSVKIKEITVSINQKTKNLETIEARMSEEKLKNKKVEEENQKTKEKEKVVLDNIDKAKLQKKHTDMLISACESEIEKLKKAENPYTTACEVEKTKKSKLISLISDIESELNKLNKEKELVDFWIHAFGPQGIPSYILDGVLSFLDMKANQCLSYLVSSDMLIGFNTQTTLKSGDTRDKFSVEIYRGGKLVEFVDLSKGEGVKVTFAVNYALKELAKIYNNIEINFDWYDEVLDGLDEVGCYQLISFLRQESKHIPNIFVISHNDNLKNLFDRQLVVMKKDGISSIQ